MTLDFIKWSHIILKRKSFLSECSVDFSGSCKQCIQLQREILLYSKSYHEAQRSFLPFTATLLRYQSIMTHDKKRSSSQWQANIRYWHSLIPHHSLCSCIEEKLSLTSSPGQKMIVVVSSCKENGSSTDDACHLGLCGLVQCWGGLYISEQPSKGGKIEEPLLTINSIENATIIRYFLQLKYSSIAILV